MARTSERESSGLVDVLLTSPQRREVVWHLSEAGGTAAFDDIVDGLTRGAERTMTAVRLHHIHLPRLQAAGAIEWDYETEEVRLTPAAREEVGAGEGVLFEGFADH